MYVPSVSWAIYVLVDPRTPDDVRYVGKTVSPLRQRLASHIYNREPSRVVRWIAKLARQGVRPVIREIERGTDPDWQSREQYWIRWHRERGFRLCNLTDGGDGGLNPSQEAREKMSAAKRGKPLRLKPDSYERAAATRKARVAAGEIDLTPTPETIAKRAAANRTTWERKRADGWTVPDNWSTFRPDNRGVPCSAETKKKIGDANRGRVMSEEARLKMSKAKLGKAPHNKGLDFHEAKRIVNELGVRDLKHHRELHAAGVLPIGMPKNPQNSYRYHEEWKGQRAFFRV